MLSDISRWKSNTSVLPPSPYCFIEGLWFWVAAGKTHSSCLNSHLVDCCRRSSSCSCASSSLPLHCAQACRHASVWQVVVWQSGNTWQESVASRLISIQTGLPWRRGKALIKMRFPDCKLTPSRMNLQNRFKLKYTCRKGWKSSRLVKSKW